MAKIKSKFVCTECGYESPKWMGKCPGCHSWNTMVEETFSKTPSRHQAFQTGDASVKQKPQCINEIDREDEHRIQTKIGELDRVLGGGIVSGSLVLIGGDPGIGKSTLLLQTSAALANQHLNVLYISGEESLRQTKLRAERLHIEAKHLFLLAETNLEWIEQVIVDSKPDFVVIDSIQTIYREEVTSAPGSVSQVRECTGHLMRLAKTLNVPIFIVGHVTKDGAIAGPRMLEHMVDTVLYFEGERHHSYRILRAVKNRFGSTNELGIFEMKDLGLEEVLNPSEVFLEERTNGVAGSAIVATMEGTRPMLVEIQALVAPTSYGNPRRMATGIDHNRVSLLMAVLEKRIGMLLQTQDAYVKLAGGVKIDEPAIDLAIIVSLVSSFKDISTNPADVFIGEVGLTGEIRRVSRIEQRVHEAAKLGFKRIFLPAKNLGKWHAPDHIEIIGVETVRDALSRALGG